MAAESGRTDPLVIATFGPSTAWCGKTIVFSDGRFLLEDHGSITAADVLTYDQQGHLIWAYDGLREWVEQFAATATSAPGASVAGDGDQILEFDQAIMTAEFIRAGMAHHFDEVSGFCTMRGTTELCKLTPKKYGEYKWPKLSELHELCTGKPHAGAHDAMGDAEAVVRCLRSLRKLGFLELAVEPKSGAAPS